MISKNTCFLILFSSVFLVSLTLAASKDHLHPHASEEHDHKYRHHQDDVNDDDEDDSNVDSHDDSHDEGVLDSEEQDNFKKLTPEESKLRLGQLAGKMDSDKDGFVSEEELSKWIKQVSLKYLEDDRDKQWKTFKIKDDLLSFSDYLDATYGIQDDSHPDESIKKLKDRDEKRWNVLDSNSDGKLTKDELLKFLHPEEFAELHESVVEETIADLDRDHDGKICKEEYLRDLWQPSDSGEAEPQWLGDERKNFDQEHDKDKDGFLDKEEVKIWILPADYDHIKSEVQYLFDQADVNKDKLLSKEEIVDKYDAFVGSQATQFGDHLKVHEEL